MTSFFRRHKPDTAWSAWAISSTDTSSGAPGRYNTGHTEDLHVSGPAVGLRWHFLKHLNYLLPKQRNTHQSSSVFIRAHIRGASNARMENDIMLQWHYRAGDGVSVDSTMEDPESKPGASTSTTCPRTKRNAVPSRASSWCKCESLGRQQDKGNHWDRGYLPSMFLHTPAGAASPFLAGAIAYPGCGAGTDLHRPPILFLGHADQECNHAHFLPRLCKKHPPHMYFHCIWGLV